MQNKEDKHRFYVDIEYDDETSFGFHVEIEGKEHEIRATLMMITRGTLQASSASHATAYNMEGFPVVAYRH